MDIVAKIKDFVEEECKKPTSKYGYEPFLYHFTQVADYAGKLADEYGGDKEAILIAAWMHDIGSIVYGRKDHHITGVKIAEEKLEELAYPREKIEIVKKCILHHRGSQHDKCESLEEQIIAEADTISSFENIGGIFKAAFIYENLNQMDAKKSVKDKLHNKWHQLRFEKSKEMIRPKYEAAMLLLE